MSVFKHLTIRFQTSAQLPAPYSYQYVLSLKPSFQYLEASLELVYTDREELDLQEIEDEGFTENDDYAWSGNLEKYWREAVEDLVEQTKLQDEESNTEGHWIEIEIDDQKGFPKPETEWQKMAQELLQAVFETSEKERPFEMNILKNDSKGSQETELTASFKRRSIQLRRNPDGKPVFRYYPWKELSIVMETIFAPDYLADQATTQKPTKDGMFLNIGDEYWYEVGKQIVEPSRQSATLTPIRKLIDQLLRY